jgi:5-methylcytosine-specific restriction endonuclease McrA
VAIYALQPTWTCGKCGVEKPALGNFDMWNARGKRQISKRCRECINAGRRVGVWQIEHPRPCSGCQAEFRPAIHNQVYCPRCCRTNIRRTKAAAESARRARLRGASGRYNHHEFLEKCEAQGWLCAYCETPVAEQSASRDHDIPLSRGGSNDISNVVLACLSCNSRKNAMTGAEFRAKRALA